MNDQAQAPKHRIYLAGFMGSGKSTIGPILANTLGFDFVDIDKLIESRAGKSITEIFSEVGEQGFRSLERDALGEVSHREDIVVSLGGGTISNEENFRLLQKNGIIVYLQLSPEEVLRRMKHKTDRPLLKDPTGNTLSTDEMQKRIQELLARRSEFYGRANIVVPTERKSVGATVDEIVKKVRRIMAGGKEGRHAP